MKLLSTFVGREMKTKEENVEELVVNVDLKPVPTLTFDIRITWCTD